jgi:hypothetical protein
MSARTATAIRLPPGAVETFPATDPEEDPVLGAIRRAPHMSPAFRDRVRALDAEVSSDPSTWIPEAQFIEEERLRRLDESGSGLAAAGGHNGSK